MLGVSGSRRWLGKRLSMDGCMALWVGWSQGDAKPALFSPVHLHILCPPPLPHLSHLSTNTCHGTYPCNMSANRLWGLHWIWLLDSQLCIIEHSMNHLGFSAFQRVNNLITIFSTTSQVKLHLGLARGYG